jgi:hypothetical protein
MTTKKERANTRHLNFYLRSFALAYEKFLPHMYQWLAA